MHISALFRLIDQTNLQEERNAKHRSTKQPYYGTLCTFYSKYEVKYEIIFCPPTEMSPEQKRAVVHKRLSLVADEIFRILETLMGEYEAEVSGSHEEVERHRRLLDVTLKTEANLHRTGKFHILYSRH